MESMDPKTISRAEEDRIELLNVLTHAAGVLLGVIFLVMLLVSEWRKRNPLGMVAYAIYGICFIFLFLASTIYHAIPKRTAPQIKSFVRIFDHVAIYIFIAGSFTPPAMLLLSGAKRVIMLTLVWGIAIAGTIFKAVTYGQYDHYRKLSVALYIGMGWLGILFIRSLLTQRPLMLFLLVLAGGILYTVGTIFYKSTRFKYHHVIWHLFVLAAAVTHFIGYYNYL